MSFARRAQAEDEPKGAGGQIGLVKMRNDARIEKGGGFQRILREEIRSNQPSSLLGQFPVRRDQMSELLKTF